MATVSVLTATFERAARTLPRLYGSLLDQTFRDIEWVVVDDGSQDGTREQVERWQQENRLSIRYQWQPNRGNINALNRAVELAQGEYCAIIDDDDWYPAEAIASMLDHWRGIPDERRAEFANVEGLCAGPDGSLVGTRFPADVFDSDGFRIRTVHGVRGDTIGMFKRDVRSAYPFPEDLGWHVPEAIVLHRIARHYKTRFVNQVWAYKEYEEAGLTARTTEVRLKNPEGQLAYWREFAAMPGPIPSKARYRAFANSVRYSLLARQDVIRPVAAPSVPWTLAAWPAGLFLSLKDRWTLRVSRRGT